MPAEEEKRYSEFYATQGFKEAKKEILDVI